MGDRFQADDPGLVFVHNAGIDSTVCFCAALLAGFLKPDRPLAVAYFIHLVSCLRRRRLGRGGRSPLLSRSPDKPGFSRLRAGGHDAWRVICAGPTA
jgi:hypothetical protein